MKSVRSPFRSQSFISSAALRDLPLPVGDTATTDRAPVANAASMSAFSFA